MTVPENWAVGQDGSSVAPIGTGQRANRAACGFVPMSPSLWTTGTGQSEGARSGSRVSTARREFMI